MLHQAALTFQALCPLVGPALESKAESMGVHNLDIITTAKYHEDSFS